MSDIGPLRLLASRLEEADAILAYAGPMPRRLAAVRALLRQFRTDDIDGSIDEAIEDFRSRELPMVWWTGPSSKPPELGKYLENMGLGHVGERQD